MAWVMSDLPETRFLPRSGWRGFLCDCGHVWKQATRDYLTPSKETCPNCQSDESPMCRWPDATLEVDSWGNLIGRHDPLPATLKELESK